MNRKGRGCGRYPFVRRYKRCHGDMRSLVDGMLARRAGWANPRDRPYGLRLWRSLRYPAARAR